MQCFSFSISVLTGVLFVGACFLGQSNATAKTKTIAIGEQSSISVRQGTRFSVGNREVISVRATTFGEDKLALLVRGKRQGFSDLLIFTDGKSRKISFQVVAKRKQLKAEGTKLALQNSPAARVQPAGGLTVISGELGSVADFNLVQRMAAVKDNKIQVNVSLKPGLLLQIRDQIRWQFLLANLHHLNVHTVGRQIWISGVAATKNQKDLAMTIASDLFVNVQNHIRLDFEKARVLHAKIRILELIRQKQHNIGMQWSNMLPGLLNIQKKFTQATFNIEAALNFMMKNGMARILSEPEVRFGAMQEAELSVGGEIPVRTREGKRAAKVTWKDYGIRLLLKSQGISDDQLRLKVGVRSSQLNFAQKTGGLPSIVYNKLNTTLDLKNGETVFLSGLMQDRRNLAKEAVPYLSEIPVFGKLFESENYRNYKSELVIAMSVGIDAL